MQTFRLHSLHCCLTFRSLLRGQTMQRFFWGGPSSARACFCGAIETERASSARTVGAFKPLGYCALFSIFGLINCSPSAQRNRNRAREVRFIPGSTEDRNLYKTNALYADKSIRTQQAAILMFCDMLWSDGLFDRVHQHLLWSCYKIQQFLVCGYHQSLSSWCIVDSSKTTLARLGYRDTIIVFSLKAKMESLTVRSLVWLGKSFTGRFFLLAFTVPTAERLSLWRSSNKSTLVKNRSQVTFRWVLRIGSTNLVMTVAEGLLLEYRLLCPAKVLH